MPRIENTTTEAPKRREGIDPAAEFLRIANLAAAITITIPATA